MIEVLRHVTGFCGEHWHPNIWTAIASSTPIATAAYYIKCKCGGWFNEHRDYCKNK